MTNPLVDLTMWQWRFEPMPQGGGAMLTLINPKGRTIMSHFVDFEFLMRHRDLEPAGPKADSQTTSLLRRGQELMDELFGAVECEASAYQQFALDITKWRVSAQELIDGGQ